MMGHRAKRREEDWLPKVLVGLSVVTSIINTLRQERGRRQWERREWRDTMRYERNRRPERHEWQTQRRPAGPLTVLFILLGLFVAFMIALSILGGLLAALGGAGGGVTLCLAPLAIFFFAMWAIRKGSAAGGQASQPPAGEMWSTDRAQPARDVTLEGRPFVSAPAAEPVRRTPAAGSAPVSTLQPARAPVAAPVVDPYPDKHAPSPSEYRQRAVSYRRRIQSLIKTRRPGPLAARLSTVLESLRSWEERVGQLADRLSLYENDELIRRDIKEVPVRTARLQRLVELEVDPDIRRQMAKTLAAYQEQQRQLDLLSRVMRRTRLNLDDTLAAMGTIYSQVQVLNAMDVDGATAERIAEEINSEVNRLNDLLSALSEVNQQTVATTTPRAAQEGTVTTTMTPGPSVDEGTAEEQLAARRARLERGGAER